MLFIFLYFCLDGIFDRSNPFFLTLLFQPHHVFVFFFGVIYSKKKKNKKPKGKIMTSIQRVPGNAGGLKYASLKRPFYGDPTEVGQVFKKARFSPGLFNGGSIDENWMNPLPQNMLPGEAPIRLNLIVSSFSEDIEGDDPNADRMNFSSPVSTQTVCFLRNGNLTKSRDKNFTDVRITRYGPGTNGAYEDLMADPVFDGDILDGGSLARTNYLIARQQIAARSKGKELTAVDILKEWHPAGVVYNEEGLEGEPSKSQTMQLPNVFGDFASEGKHIVLTAHGPALVMDVWGGELPNGTPLYFILKKVPLARRYILDGPSPMQQPRVSSYGLHGRSVEPMSLEGVESLASIGGPSNLDAIKEQQRKDRAKNVHTSGEKVWQFIPYANFNKGHPMGDDLSYVDTVKYGNITMDVKMTDAIPILFGYIQKENSPSYSSDVDPRKTAIDNSATKGARLLSVIVNIPCVF